MAYKNGRLPAEVRFDVGLNDEQLPLWAKPLWDRITAAAERKGWDARAWITDRQVLDPPTPACYRGLGAQKAAEAARPFPGSAIPGTSNHGGVDAWTGSLTAAIDFGRLNAFGRLLLLQYGITFPIAAEPWHGVFPQVDPAGWAGVEVTPITFEEDDMAHTPVRQKNGARWAIQWDQYVVRKITGPGARAEFDALCATRADGDAVVMTATEIEDLRRYLREQAPPDKLQRILELAKDIKQLVRADSEPDDSAALTGAFGL